MHFTHQDMNLLYLYAFSWNNKCNKYDSGMRDNTTKYNIIGIESNKSNKMREGVSETKGLALML